MKAIKYNKKVSVLILLAAVQLTACNSNAGSATSPSSKLSRNNTPKTSKDPTTPPASYDACLPEKPAYPCTGDGCTGPVPSNWIVDGQAPNTNSNAHLTPGEIYTKNKYSYGRWVGVLKAANVDGADTSFFLFNYVGAEKSWPANWHEIDFEFNPGLRPGDSNVMNGEFYPDGSRRLDRYLSLTNNGDGINDIISPLPEDNSTGAYDDFVSINTFAFDKTGNTKASNHQYMYKMNQSPYTSYHTYEIDYTPNGIWWKIDGVVVTHADDTFLKDPSKNFKNPSCADFIHTTDMDNFRVDPALNMYVNLWDGALQASQYWTGKTAPTAGAAAVYQSIKYYPLTNKDCQGQAQCTDEANYTPTPELSSDFENDQYQLNNQTVGFNDIWETDTNYYQSLGGTFGSDSVVEKKGTGLTITLNQVQGNKPVSFNGEPLLKTIPSTSKGINVAYITKKSCLAGDPYIELGTLDLSNPVGKKAYNVPGNDVIGIVFSTMDNTGTKFFGACGVFPQTGILTDTSITPSWTESVNPNGLNICGTNAAPYFYNANPDYKTGWKPQDCPTLPPGFEQQ